MKLDTEETPPSESTDQEFNEDVLKQESEQVEAESADMKARKLNKVTPEMVTRLSESLKNDWKKLAAKLGYTNDEVRLDKLSSFSYYNTNTIRYQDYNISTNYGILIYNIYFRLFSSKAKQRHTNSVKLCSRYGRKRMRMHQSRI